MSVARRRWSPDEKRTVLQLHKEDYTYRQIAEKLRPGVASAWRSVGEIVRESRNQTESQTITDQPVGSGTQQHQIVAPRVKHASKIELPETMADSLTAREFLTMMDDDQRAIFVATYEDLRGDADEESLTRAENEMLIRAAFSNVKYLRAQSLLNVSESYLMLDMEGGLADNDEGKARRRFAGRGDAYKKEAEQWQKEYMDYLTELKLTRRQRLDKIKDTRNTFLDLQQELSNKIQQDSMVEDIKRINKATTDEFHRMSKGETGPDGQRHPWLIGAFDEFVDPPDDKEVKDEGGSLSDQKPQE